MINNGRIISKKRINMIKLNIYKNFNMNLKENIVEDATIDNKYIMVNPVKFINNS